MPARANGNIPSRDPRAANLNLFTGRSVNAAFRREIEIKCVWCTCVRSSAPAALRRLININESTMKVASGTSEREDRGNQHVNENYFGTLIALNILRQDH